MPYRIKTLMRSVNKISHGVLHGGVHEGQNEILIMKSFVLLLREYLMFLCFAEGLCSMFSKGFMFLCCVESLCFYVLLRVYVLCCVESLCSMFCKEPTFQRDRPKTITTIGMQMQQTLPAFAPRSAYLDSEISETQTPYFAMSMKEMKGVEETMRRKNAFTKNDDELMNVVF